MSRIIKSSSVKMQSIKMISHQTEQEFAVDDSEGEEVTHGKTFKVDVKEAGNKYAQELELMKEETNEILQETEQMVKDLIETARIEGEKIIKNAKEDADKVISAAREKSTEIEEEAIHKGQKIGFEEGLRNAESDYQGKLQEAQDIVEKANQERKEILVCAEGEIVQLALAVARKVIVQEISLNPNYIVDIAKRAIQKATDREELTIRVSPDNLDDALNAQEEIFKSAKGIRKLKVLADPTVTAGGCVVESSNGTVDARLERQLNEIEQALTEVIPNV